MAQTVLTPPSGARVLESPSARVWIEEDGIVRLVIHVSRVDGEANRSHNDMVESLVGDGGPMPVLADVRRVRWATPTARSESARAAAYLSSVAMLVSNPVTRMVGSFFMRVAKPAYPARMFSDLEPALAWLAEHRDADHAALG